MIYAATNEDCTKCITADYALLACTNSTKDTVNNVSQELAMKCTCQQSFINEYASTYSNNVSHSANIRIDICGSKLFEIKALITIEVFEK
ncbi:29502_t:CDS:2, partial [Gigaspora margarita]